MKRSMSPTSHFSCFSSLHSVSIDLSFQEGPSTYSFLPPASGLSIAYSDSARLAGLLLGIPLRSSLCTMQESELSLVDHLREQFQDPTSSSGFQRSGQRRRTHLQSCLPTPSSSLSQHKTASQRTCYYLLRKTQALN